MFVFLPKSLEPGFQTDEPVQFSPPQQDKWHPLLSTVSHVQKYRWLRHGVQGVSSQSSLMATIVEFALKEEPLDVEKMRKCLLKQVTVGLSQPCSGVVDHLDGRLLAPTVGWSRFLTGVSLLQLERAEVRLEGIDTMLKLASKSFLLPSVQYAMLCGWQRVIPEGTNIG